MCLEWSVVFIKDHCCSNSTLVTGAITIDLVFDSVVIFLCYIEGDFLVGLILLREVVCRMGVDVRAL